MAHTPKREFLDLKVNEVSLVDTPANEKRFIVMKRLQGEETMSTENVEVNKSADGKSDVLGELAALVAKAKKAEYGDAPDKDSKGDAAALLANLAGSKKAKKAMKFYKKALKAKPGMTEEMMTKAMADAEKLFGAQDGETDGKPPLAKTKKSMEDGGNDVDAMVTKTLEGVFMTISKAKVFTPKRQEAFKAAMATLKGVLDDLEANGSKDTIPSAEDMASQTSLPRDPKVPDSGLQDIKNAPVMKALTQLVELTKGLNDRLTSVEKTRQPATGSGESEVTDTKTAKSGAGLWSTIL